MPRSFFACLPEGIRPGAEAWVREAFASRIQLTRGRVMLDVAMILFQRARVAELGSLYRYPWGDATATLPNLKQ